MGLTETAPCHFRVGTLLTEQTTLYTTVYIENCLIGPFWTSKRPHADVGIRGFVTMPLLSNLLMLYECLVLIFHATIFAILRLFE